MMILDEIIKQFYKMAVILIALLLMAGASFAADVNLAAQRFDKIMPDGTSIAMWGFARKATNNCAAADILEGPSVPGPRITVLPGDPNLNIYVCNKLNVPVSIVIPGQITSMAPVMFDPDDGGPDVRLRVKSLTHETPASNVDAVLYQWTDLQPGTYLYHSGSHIQVQVQMGLYGMATKDAAANQAYNDVSTAYQHEIIFILSEIDPALHEAVDTGTYGTTMTSTLDYDPQYFLVNGEPFSAYSPPLFAGYLGDNTLIRFMNAGIKTHVPVLQDMYMTVLAEDGNMYPYPRNHYSLILPALKTSDAIISPASGGVYSFTDRRLYKSSPGGMLAFLAVSDGPDNVGPVTSGVTAVPNTSDGKSPVTLTATADDTTTGNSVISGAEWFIDIDPGEGNGNAVAAQDGAFNETNESVTASIDIAVLQGLSNGNHNVFIRSRDVVGNWGAAGSVILSVELPCGDGILDLFEECDDGNQTNGDGCDDDANNGGNCTVTGCGNGVVTGTEQCDDGNTADGDGCNSICVLEFCGDSIVNNAGTEQCDEGGENTITCDADCTLPVCGDGTLNTAAGEECDDGNTTDGDGCEADCTTTCVPSDVLEITAGQQLGGNPIDLTSIVTTDNATNVMYTVTGGGSTCDIDSGGTYIEAENFTGTINQGTGTFSVESSQGGQFGSYLRSSSGSTGSCPSTHEGKEYEVNFTETGTYNVWMRSYGPGDGSDSVYIGLDGACAGAITKGGVWNQWAWTNNIQNGSNTINVTTVGNHTLNIWVRESYHLVDGIYITQGVETPTDGSHGVEIDPNNCSSLLFPVAGNTDPANVITNGWTAGTMNLEVTGDDGTCLTTLTPAVGTFTYSLTP
jgi:cysteine-rich repeat protein